MRLCELRERLAGRIHAADIAELGRVAHGERGSGVKSMLYSLAFCDDRRVSSNALWVFSHFKPEDMRWLAARRQALTDRAMSVPDATRRRLLLTLLERMDFEAADIRADFLDFCLARMLADGEPVGVRTLCVKLAYKMCRHYPELLDELRRTLGMIPGEGSSPALRACRRNMMRRYGDGTD